MEAQKNTWRLFMNGKPKVTMSKSHFAMRSSWRDMEHRYKEHSCQQKRLLKRRMNWKNGPKKFSIIFCWYRREKSEQSLNNGQRRGAPCPRVVTSAPDSAWASLRSAHPTKVPAFPSDCRLWSRA